MCDISSREFCPDSYRAKTKIERLTSLTSSAPILAQRPVHLLAQLAVKSESAPRIGINFPLSWLHGSWISTTKKATEDRNTICSCPFSRHTNHEYLFRNGQGNIWSAWRATWIQIQVYSQAKDKAYVSLAIRSARVNKRRTCQCVSQSQSAR